MLKTKGSLLQKEDNIDVPLSILRSFHSAIATKKLKEKIEKHYLGILSRIHPNSVPAA